MPAEFFTVRSNLLPRTDHRYKKWSDSLKKRPAPWNKGYKKDNHPSLLKTSNTFKSKHIDNFAIWRKNARIRGLIPDSYPDLERNIDLAFLFGLVLGDGNLYKFPRTECLRIILGTDKPLLWQYARDIVRKVFAKEPSVKKRSNAECVDVKIYQKNLSKRLGIPLGARGKLLIKLSKWIWNDKRALIACLKGLFEAEGSFSIHLPTSTYNLSFSNRNVSLLNEVEKALIILGFHPERRYNAVRLRKKAEAFDFVELIQFRKYNSI